MKRFYFPLVAIFCYAIFQKSQRTIVPFFKLSLVFSGCSHFLASVAKITGFIALYMLNFPGLGQSIEVLKDINTTKSEVSPSQFKIFNDELYFTYDDGIHGEELWKIGNTGDSSLVIDLKKGLLPSNIEYLEVFNGNLYFSAVDTTNSNSKALYKTDGTTEGTELVHSELNHYQSLTSGSTVLFFTGGDGSSFTPNLELWKTDGTSEGTALVKEINPGGTEFEEYGSTPSSLFFHNSLLFFNATDGTNGKELWVSDGTETGTIMILDRSDFENDSGNPRNFRALGNDVYFTALSEDFGNQGVWKTDGTPEGTVEIRSLTSTNNSTDTSEGMAGRFKEWNGYLYYWDRSGGSGSYNLFSYDGSTETIIDNASTAVAPFTLREGVGDSLYYSKVISTDKAVSGVGVDNSSYSVTTSAFSDTETYFISGTKLYNYNGGTPVEVSDLSVVPNSLIGVSDKVYYMADKELFSVSGNTINQELGNQLTNGSGPFGLTVYNETLYFSAFDGTTTNLYESDGTSENTVIVPGGEGLGIIKTEYDGLIYYASGADLKSFDGIDQTVLHTLPGTITEIAVAGNTIFIASDNRLFTFNGVDTPTEIDLNTGGSQASPGEFINLAGTLFFEALDVDFSSSVGLWKTDGTQGGTELVYSQIQGDVENIKAFGDSLFFTAYSALPGEYNLYKSDASGNVTKLFQINANLDVSLAAFNDNIYMGYGTSTSSLRELTNEGSGEIINLDGYNSCCSPKVQALKSSLLVNVSSTSYFMNKAEVVSKVSLPFIGFTIQAQSFGPADILYLNNLNLVETDGTSAGTKSIGQVLEGSNTEGSFIEYNGTTYIVGSYQGSGEELLKITTSTNTSAISPASSLAVAAGAETTIAEVSLSPGGGDGRLILAFQGDSISYPVNGINYTATAEIGSNDTIQSGTYVLSAANETSLTVNGLIPGETYQFLVIEYSDAGGGNLSYDRANAVGFTYEAPKIDQTISFPDPGDVPLIDGSIDLQATASSELEVSYSIISAPNGAFFIDENTLSLGSQEAGEFIIQASQSGNTQYNAANDVEITFNSVKSDPEIVFDLGLEMHEYGQEFTLNTASSIPENTIDPFVESGPASISFGEISFSGIGEVVLGAGFAGNTFYEADTLYDTLQVVKGTQVISAPNFADRQFGSTFSINLVTVNTSAVGEPQGDNYPTNQYLVTAIEGPVAIVDSVGQNPELEVTGTGSVVMSVINKGNDFWNASNTLVINFEAIKADQSLTGGVPSQVSFSNEDYDLSELVVSNAGLFVGFEIISGPGSISEDTLYIFEGIGNVEVKATTAISENFNEATASFTFTIIKGDQTLTFDPEFQNTSYSEDLKYKLGATASSGLEISYEVTGTGEGTIEEDTLYVTQAGGFGITASQPGNDNWNAPQSIQRNFTVSPTDQTITIEPIPDKLVTDEPFELSYSVSSGLEATINSNTGRTSVDGNTVTINGTGQETLVFEQNGNANYNYAQTTISFCISPAKPTLTLEGNVITADNTANTISWYLDGAHLTDGGSPLIVEEEGSYTAIAIAGDGCPDSDESDPVVYEEEEMVPLGIDNHSSVALYPNPVTNELMVQLNGLKQVQLSLMNTSGKELLSKVIKDENDVIDVSEYPAGIYFIYLKGENLKLSERIIIAK